MSTHAFLAVLTQNFYHGGDVNTGEGIQASVGSEMIIRSNYFCSAWLEVIHLVSSQSVNVCGERCGEHAD